MACSKHYSLDMKSELNRLSTFINFPASSSSRPQRLARNGFHCADDASRVVCYECGYAIPVGSCRPGSESPGVRHRRDSPSCHVANPQNNVTNNIPMQLLPAGAVERFRSRLHRNGPDSVRNGQGIHRLGTGRDATDCDTATECHPPGHTGTSGSYVNPVCVSILLRGLNLVEPISSTVTTVSIDPSNPDYDALRRENIRLGTFRNFPAHCPVRPVDLARSGFFYVGPDDRVCCAFCRGFLRNWASTDVAVDEHRKHFSDCPMMRGVEVGNVPLERDVECRLELVGGEMSTETDHGLIAAATLDEMGFGRYEQTTRQEAERHLRASIVPRSTAGLPSLRLETLPPMQQQSNESMLDAGQPSVVSLTFDPSQPPKHPEFSQLDTRRRTFLVPGITIPNGQNVDVLVDAGFYHVGPHDNVKCFYCDVGLKNFQPTDDPWLEHAKWFPRCSYVRQKKDAAFIQRATVERNNWLMEHGQQRAMMAGPTSNIASLTSLDIATAAGTSVGRHVSTLPAPARMSTDGVSTPHTGTNAGPAPVDVTSSMAAAGSAAAAAAAASASTSNVAPSSATQAPTRPPSRKNKKKKKKEEVSKALQLSETSAKNLEVDFREDEVALDPETDPEAELLLAENRELREARTCKVCMDEEVNVVFLPCGHLVCCDSCAPALRNCAVCRSLIRGTVKIFLS